MLDASNQVLCNMWSYHFYDNVNHCITVMSYKNENEKILWYLIQLLLVNVSQNLRGIHYLPWAKL